MKKTLMCIGLLLLSSSMVFAQKAKVNKAYNYLWTEPINYESARAAIEEAKADSVTGTEAKTWYVAGRIGYTQANEEIKKTLLNQTPDNDRLYVGLDEMFTNYLVADKYDGKLDKKGKAKYTQRKTIKADFMEMHNQYISTGASFFDQRKFNEAAKMFNEYVAISDLSMFDAKDGVKVDSTYWMVKHYVALSNIRAEKNAEAIKDLLELKDTKYNDMKSVYELLVSAYINSGDTINYVASLKEGADKFPSSDYFVGSLVNYYVGAGEYDKAMSYLDQVIAKDPNNTEYMNVKAELLVQKNDYEKAKEILNKSLSVDAKNARTLYVYGRAWAFEGDHIQESAQDLTDNAKYNAEMSKAKSCYIKALEYYEPAKEVMQKDNVQYMDLLQNMKVLYLRLEQTDKYNAISEEIKAL
ncbi:MAG: tetratricopeptide repeat protein [Bacteroidia bacterium]|nr:tetratricopeptide repeat protein [Bacteroidia bacterium]